MKLEESIKKLVTKVIEECDWVREMMKQTSDIWTIYPLSKAYH